MQPVRLVELRVARDAVEEERIERDAVAPGEVGIDRVELLLIVRRRGWARRACRSAASAICAAFALARISASAAFAPFGRQAAQHVVGAEFDDQRVGPLRARSSRSARARPPPSRRRRRRWSPRRRSLWPAARAAARRETPGRAAGRSRRSGCRRARPVCSVRAVAGRGEQREQQTAAIAWTQSAKCPYEAFRRET